MKNYFQSHVVNRQDHCNFVLERKENHYGKKNKQSYSLNSFLMGCTELSIGLFQLVGLSVNWFEPHLHVFVVTVSLHLDRSHSHFVQFGYPVVS